MEYDFRRIEQDWRKWWTDNAIYKTTNDAGRPKHYVLDMFPYPSGAGLHVGHPLGYIASDIYARYKRQRGYNVLHPMGFDAFGLPAEQYAIETGQHPAITTEQNIKRYREQLDNIGFSYDWDREVRTSDPAYYKWTQWIFTKLFHSWFDRKSQKARPIEELIAVFEKEGCNTSLISPGKEDLCFTREQWKQYTIAEQRACLMHFRIAYLDYAEVWWCEALGTVLANDEVVNGVSERGGYPVVKRQMRQWFLRITEYAERLLESLEGLDWSDAMKDMQRNWIGKSNGAQLSFDVKDSRDKITVFTTRPDTIFGVDFMVLAPEHPLVSNLTTELQQKEVAEYKLYVERRSERERMSEVKQVTGAFTGAYAVHPFTRKPIPVYIAEYVLAGYGTGAIMGVPSGDERDHLFARHFGIHITNVFGANYKGDAAYTEKAGTIEGSDFLSGLSIPKAIDVAIRAIEDAGIGDSRVNYKLRDAGFSRQRYWGEPFPVIYHNDVPYTIDEGAVSYAAPANPHPVLPPKVEGDMPGNLKQKDTPDTSFPLGGKDGMGALPVKLPHVDTYKPGPEGQGPLANLEDWVNTPAGRRETNTMPGYAGSSWYFFRYMDPHNEAEFASREATDYWQQVDVYVGGTEHAVGHLLYARMWTKVLFDLGYVSFEEPFKKLVNQGMIQGSSRFVYRVNGTNIFLSRGVKERLSKSDPRDGSMEEVRDYANGQLGYIAFQGPYGELTKEAVKITDEDSKDWYKTTMHDISELHVDVNLVSGEELRIEDFQSWREEYNDAEFVLEFETDKYLCGSATEKMSKRYYNVVNPDDIVAQYGADTFRMYEMFLGPIEVSKPWDTKGIEGVHRFLKKLWRLYVNDAGEWLPQDVPASEAEVSRSDKPDADGASASLSHRRIIHKTIKKVGDDIERFGLNTCVSAFMICVNELSASGCRSRDVLEALVVILAPFAPHVAEELWHRFGHESSVVLAPFPKWEEAYLAETSKMYPVAINGKTRTELPFALDASQSSIEKEVLADATVIKWLEGKTPKKIVFVKGRMINVVV